MDGADEKLQALDRHATAAGAIYFIFERGRQSRLQSLLPAETRGSFKVIYDANNKFSVAYAEI